MDRSPLTVVLDHRDTAKVALNVLAGALETDPRTAAVPLVFCGRRGDLAAEVARAVESSEWTLVLWSFYSPSFGEAAARLRAVRERVPDPRALHVAGGVHASAEPLMTARAGFDLVAVGEGERTIVDLVRALLDGADLRSVRGVARAGPLGLLPFQRGEAVALDDWPPFAPAHRRIGPIEITRGCIYACRFCQTPFMNRARFRHRSLENTLRWVRFMREHETRDYRFISPTSLSYGSDDGTPCLDRLEALLRAVREEIGPGRRLFYGTFPSEVRPEHVSEEALALLARYVDNRSIIIGGQSGSERVLAESGRGHDAASIERAVATAARAGWTPHVDFIFGLPGEAPADVEATLSLAEQLAAIGARIHGHTFMPLPGTPWKDASPGSIAPETRRRLSRLAGERKLYGEWERQESFAREIAARRRAARAGA
jgi:B12-binding domain/radical SAM domain protein